MIELKEEFIVLIIAYDNSCSVIFEMQPYWWNSQELVNLYPFLKRDYDEFYLYADIATIKKISDYFKQYANLYSLNIMAVFFDKYSHKNLLCLILLVTLFIPVKVSHPFR